MNRTNAKMISPRPMMRNLAAPAFILLEIVAVAVSNSGLFIVRIHQKVHAVTPHSQQLRRGVSDRTARAEHPGDVAEIAFVHFFPCQEKNYAGQEQQK